MSAACTPHHPNVNRLRLVDKLRQAGIEQIVITRVGEQAGNTALQRLPTGAREDRTGLRADRTHKREIGRGLFHHGGFGTLV